MQLDSFKLTPLLGWCKDLGARPKSCITAQPENLDSPLGVEFKTSERAATQITAYVFITLLINCSNAGYPCRGSKSGVIFSQM